MGSLKAQMARGMMWTAVGKYVGIVVQLVLSMILARLVSPEDFGVVAIAQIAINFVCILSDLGVGTAVIQNKTLTDKDLDSIFTFTILFATALSIVVVGVSPFIAQYYDNQKLTPILIMISVAMLLNIIDTVPTSLFMKDKRFAFVAKRNLLFGVVGGVISITYAFMGGGCYALVLAPIIIAMCLLIVNLHQYPRHIDWHMHLEPIRKIFSFSVFQMLFNVVNYFSRNLDKLIIGKSLNMNELGYYQKSYQLMLMPLQNVTFVITPVLQPFLSDFQNDLNFISERYLKIIKFVATLSVPIGILLYFTGYEIIYMLFGENWISAVPAFEILAWSIPFQMVLSTTGSIFLAANKTNMLFLNGCINTCVTVVGFIICAFLHGGLEGFALAWTITNVMNFMTSYIILYRVIFHRSLLPVYKQFIHPLINGCLVFILCFGIARVFGHQYIVATLMLKSVMTGLCTILVISFFKDYELKIYYMLLKNKILGYVNRKCS